VPTGEIAAPYLPRAISKSVGCIAHKSIVLAEDEHGNPALYFLSHRGPYRIGSQGLQYLGRDLEDLWATVNLGASNVVCHGVYHADKHQVWYWIATGNANDPNKALVFDVHLGREDENGAVRNGWSVFTGDLGAARCSAMFANTLGASMSRDLKPHIGQAGAAARLWKGDTGTDDAGTAFQAYVDLPAKHFGGLGRKCQINQGLVLGSAGSQTLRLTFTRDYGFDSSTADVAMTAQASETRVQKPFEAAQVADAMSVQIRIGDGSAVSNSWTIDALVLQPEQREDIAA